ncbi:flagellar hook assembly protein FlgD [Guyparkeria sp. SCN-R1]|uniref:flagellar hook assembly protein FlgD n=1 Tax=Guyparkeria sp. SCN-R1 TaxID=2341113 RepID=UPI000F64B08E|nr:flagellar hook assembly protein FlgD [Guyparkeria sp. SCN-R1]RRQ24163.1 flagellar hook assembly protein FlgD [Guyparkeria sp. SCN-R1]
MTSSVSNDIYADLGLAASKGSKDENKAQQNLGQDDFLKLLTTQMENQDPFEPMDNTQFVAQMAQFSSLQGIQDLNATVSGFEDSVQSNQVIQASGLVGKAAMVKGDTAQMYHMQQADGSVAPSGILGSVDVPDGASKMNVEITNAYGQVVKTIDVPVDGSDRPSFSWDGRLKDGRMGPEGNYKVNATATVDGKGQAPQTYVGAVIESVGVTKNGPELNLDGLSSVKLADIVEIIN